jgi:toxin YoeB
VNVHFTDIAWEDYRFWLRHDDAILRKINDLIEDARRCPFTGLGKPEPLKGDLAGWWSRRITGDHRLVYRVAGRRGADQRIEIAFCRYRYERD